MDKFLSVPYSVLKNKEISLACKLLFADIISLSKNEGFCFASNEYFSTELGLSDRAVVYSIKELKDKGFITTERKHYIRYIRINPEKFKITPKIITANFADKNANSSHTNANFAETNANSAQYNINYNNNKNNNYKKYSKNNLENERKRSYNLKELMKIK